MLIYNVSINLADAASFGVPQRRHRVFFVGFRNDLQAGWSFPKPTHTHASCSAPNTRQATTGAPMACVTPPPPPHSATK